MKMSDLDFSSPDPIIFLDTNVLIDVIERRNREVKIFVDWLVRLHNRGDILLSTSIFNLIELFDKLFEISYYAECLKERVSGDVIVRRRGSRSQFYCERTIRNKEKVIGKVSKFLERNDLTIFDTTLPLEERDTLCQLLGERGVRSQDAIIVSCAIENESDYFFTSDNDLKSALASIMYAFDISKERDREQIRRTVLG